jgi:glucose-6-phosphate isomerase
VQLPQWQALAAHAVQMRQRHLRDLFAADAQRPEKLSRTELNLLFDFSRQRLDAETIRLLIELAQARGLQQRIAAMFAGEKINTTENQLCCNVALRNRSTDRSSSTVRT